MPNDASRTRKGSGLMSEANLARRIAWEMHHRGWSQERMAKEMTDAGHPLHQSSISKIVNPKDGKRRAISVDDCLGFARVFDVTLDELLIPLEAVWDCELRAALEHLQDLHQQRETIDRALIDVVTHIVDLFQAAGETAFEKHMRAVDETARQRLLAELTRWGQQMRAQLDDTGRDGLTDGERTQRLHHILYGDQPAQGDAS